MSKFNIGDRVISKGYPNLGEEVGIVAGIDLEKDTGDGKYLVKFNSLDICSGWGYGIFRDDCDCIIEPYEGYAEWVDEDDLVKVEDECEEEVMNEFNIGDRVVAKDYPSIVKEVGVVVGIDPREGFPGKYLVKFDSLDTYEGWSYGYRFFINNPDLAIEPYEGRAVWLEEEDLVKVENECEEKCEEENEEDVKIKFARIRKQKKEVVKEMSEKVLEMTLEIKEMEHEIEKIKKEWHL